MMRNLSIEFKMIISVVLFTLFTVGLERYQLSENVMEQFIASKKAKNKLLIDTIAPIISLNFSLGLVDANKEYLDHIVKQNSDLDFVSLIDSQGNIIYEHSKNLEEELQDDHNHNNVFNKDIIDSLTDEKIGVVTLHFYNDDYQKMRTHSRKITVQIFGITLLSLGIFILLIQRELKDLKQLSENVLKYSPQKNNFTLLKSSRSDEVGVIHNAIVSMVEKIASHAKMLDEVNLSLEQKVQERTRELEQANKKLQALSTTDQLTQLSNRRHFQEHIAATWDLAKREGVYLSVIMADVDHFKKINDTYGHFAGDTVLKEVASSMKNALKRTTDFIARYGGEEFIVVLYDTDIQKARNVCETIQSAIADIDSFEDHGFKIKSVTMSFGICSMIPKADEHYETLIKCSDRAMYQAKEEGRDRICWK